jgi:hypothetical protein
MRRTGLPPEVLPLEATLAVSEVTAAPKKSEVIKEVKVEAILVEGEEEEQTAATHEGFMLARSMTQRRRRRSLGSTM